MGRPATGQVLERRTKDGGIVYALRFRVRGQREYVTLGTEEEGWTAERAKEELANHLTDVRRGTYVTQADLQAAEDEERASRFDLFAREWLESRTLTARPNTVAAYGHEVGHLIKFFGARPLATIGARDVDRFRDFMLAQGRSPTQGTRRPRKDLSPAYVNACLSKLHAIFKRAVRYDLVARNPVEDIDRAKGERFRRDYLETVQQARALLDAAGELDQEARADRQHVGRRAMVAVMLFGGLRVTEAATLRWRDVNLSRGTLKVIKSKTNAGERKLQMVPALAAELRAWKAQRQPSSTSALVFATATGGRPGKDNIARRVVRPAVDRANQYLPDEEQIGNVTPHGLRVTCTSMMIEAGENPRRVADNMGHEDATTTLRIYTRTLGRGPGDPGAWATLMGTGVGTSGPEESLASPSKATDSGL